MADGVGDRELAPRRRLSVYAAYLSSAFLIVCNEHLGGAIDLSGAGGLSAPGFRKLLLDEPPRLA